jgi:hypothetical protein
MTTTWFTWDHQAPLQWHPAKPIDDFLKNKLDRYREQGKIKPQEHKIAGKNALIFVTYSGPHTE